MYNIKNQCISHKNYQNGKMMNNRTRIWVSQPFFLFGVDCIEREGDLKDTQFNTQNINLF